MINSADTAYYTSIAGSVSSSSNWLASTETAIKNSQNQGGLLGMLSAATDGSVSSFLSNSATSANAFATISQTSVSSASTFYAQIAAQNVKTQQQKKLQDAMDSLQAQQKMVPVQSTLDPFIYFPDGSNIDTTNNILTMSDGTQYDTTTGAKYVDPSSIIQMANGAYLDTKNNIMTMPDGSQIDTVTGLTVAKTA